MTNSADFISIDRPPNPQGVDFSVKIEIILVK